MRPKNLRLTTGPGDYDVKLSLKTTYANYSYAFLNKTSLVFQAFVLDYDQKYLPLNCFSPLVLS